MPRAYRAPTPLDSASLERLALRYVERFQTSRGKLAAYLDRKLRERGWEGERPDSAAVAERMATLGYVDDRAFAEAKAGAMGRRGLGRRRVAEALRHAAIDGDTVAETLELSPPLESALAFAKRKRIGPFAARAASDDERRRQLAAMLRAGHAYPLARKLLALAPGAEIDVDALEP